jgi:hypothetical protein
MDFPFQQYIKEGKIVRVFTPDVDDDELKWHQDTTDRKVTVIQHGEWEFQMEDDLPVKLSNAEQIYIPKFVWHRVIRGIGTLIVEIEQY